MSKNIKEIGKELLGKSLNSFHRKTGLTQLEKNNEMQDGILDGILSQVDDAHIEKTEQSNVIHLDGSGDGVVVLDSIEGNTMVNLCVDKTEHINKNYTSSFLTKAIKHNTEYTVAFELFNITQGSANRIGVSIENAPAYEMNFANFTNGFHKVKVVTRGNNEPSRPSLDLNENVYACFWIPVSANGLYSIKNVVVLEGDWTEKEIPYFEGLQSSFEEKVNDDGKYEIEILSHKGRPNELKNSFKELQASPREYMSISITDIAKKYLGKRLVVSGKVKSIGKNGDVRIYSLGKYSVGFSTLFNCNTSNYINFVCEGRFTYEANGANGEVCNLSFYGTYDSGIFPCVKDIKIEILDDNDNILATEWCPNYKDDEIHWKNHKKSNKIKLLLNAPLRAVGDIKDRLCVKDDKLVVERNCGIREYQEGDLELENTLSDMMNTIYLLDEICYEEVTNEYGEPILLEGYENGTLYIDSTIMPTTTVSYTPKMETLNTLKEVYNNNVMLTSDVNDNIIPYMMEVDLMIMEKEMALPSQINNRKVEVLDMTSMQKRTQEMLERLIKGKTLTEQECKTRVTTYLNAGKITDEQAEELMLVISEIYN